MEIKDIVYGIGLFLTFVLGVWNLIVNYRNTRRTNFINTVTAQRVKWIEQLRQDISAYSGLTHTWCFSGLEGTSAELEVVKEIDRLRRVIRLRLNPIGRYDQRIEELVETIPTLTDISQRDKLKTALEDLIVATQGLLKEEWEKVKGEAEHGSLASR